MKKAFLRLFVALLVVGTLLSFESKKSSCPGVHCQYLIPVTGPGHTGGEMVMPCLAEVEMCAALYCSAHIGLPHNNIPQ